MQDILWIWLIPKRLGIARVITYGNRADVNESDSVRFFEADMNTKMIGAYLEGIEDGRDFLESARYAASLKPVVVLKTGKQVRWIAQFNPTRDNSREHTKPIELPSGNPGFLKSIQQKTF